MNAAPNPDQRLCGTLRLWANNTENAAERHVLLSAYTRIEQLSAGNDAVARDLPRVLARVEELHQRLDEREAHAHHRPSP